MISVLALIYSLQGINNKANTGSLHYYIFINLLLIQTLENGIKYYQTNKRFCVGFVSFYVQAHPSYLANITFLIFFTLYMQFQLS
jgi:hypothetical protein